MMFNEVIYLASEVSTDRFDEYGDVVKEFVYERRFCEQMSIGITEFYQAQTSEYKPEIKFKLADYADYDNQPYVVHNDMMYKVLRTYRNNKTNEIEITCYGGVRNVSAQVGD